MGIRNEFPKVWDSFAGGRFTHNNLVHVSDDHVLIARDLIFPGDGIAHKRPGYTQVGSGAFNLAPIRRIFDFQRQSDATQRLFLTGGGKIATIKTDGTGFTLLSSAEDPFAVFDFATGVFECYAANGVKMYRFADVGGVLTQWPWGFTVPAAAPTIALSAGTLTLTKGRQYAFSPVSKWTDSQGVLRVGVGAPSPLSAHTGPFTNQIVSVGGIPASAGDPQVTHWWIWATNDSPLNTSSALFFLAEITVGATVYGDALADTALDTTRLIPYNNTPPPVASVLIEYQQRIVFIGIPGKPNLVQATGLEEISVGIPQQTAPLSVFFNVPGGIKKLVGGCVFNQSLMLATPDFWFQVQGLTADTFQERDKLLQPGLAGPRALVTTPTYMVWLGTDRKIWAWNGVSDPVEMSWKIARADGSQQLSMESLNPDALANAELRWYNFGRYNLIAAFVSTQNVIDPKTNRPYFDWVQLWDATAMHSPAGPFGQTTKDGRLQGTAESDMFPNDKIVASGAVMVGNTPYLFFGDSLGNVFRWPDGWTDNGATYAPMLGSEFSDLDQGPAKKHNHFLDVLTSRLDAQQAYTLAAIGSDGIFLDQRPIGLTVGAIPSDTGKIDPTALRGKMNQPGVSIGRFLRWFVGFPQDDQDAEVYSVIARASLLGKDLK